MQTTSGCAVVPGEILGSTKDNENVLPGEGVYIAGDTIRSAIVGFVRKHVQDGKTIIEVARPDQAPTIVPKLSDTVVGMVTKVNPRLASVKILCVGDVPLSNDFPAIIRQHEVRQTQVDQIEMYKCFRPGDIVRAEVISLGDKSSYYLTTAKNEYGVIFAKSVAGATMVPISWDLMQCPKTKMTEYRKVAKTS